MVVLDNRVVCWGVWACGIDATFLGAAWTFGRAHVLPRPVGVSLQVTIHT
jgi:hypothetical protein